MREEENDSIAAISTPVGEAGIGIIRVSGPGARGIMDKVFRPGAHPEACQGAGSGGLPGLGAGPSSHRLVYGHVWDPESGEVLDEAMACFMAAPRTYTREDVLEIDVHSGPHTLSRVLGTVLAAGARLAEPGEFTRRAFLNGRLDLAQAEAVMGLIRAQTDAARRAAMEGLDGRLSREVRRIRRGIMEVLAYIEATLDFPEEEIDPVTPGWMESRLEEARAAVEVLVAGARTGRILREGLPTVIAGRPNVGKSSLLNALLGTERAIVTSVPGTTRDAIEEGLNVRGIPLRIIDTAGLREAADAVEKIGVERSRELVHRAGLVLLVLDAAEGLTAEDEEIARELVRTGVPALVVLNKRDLGQPAVTEREIHRVLPATGVLLVSALTGEGLADLEEAIYRTVTGGQAILGEGATVGTARQEAALRETGRHLDEALSALREIGGLDLAAIDLRAAAESLGRITGETAGEDLLDQIFSQFCIGK